MIDFDSLSKDPSEAILTLSSQILGIVPIERASFDDFRKAEPKAAMNVVLLFKAIFQISPRILDSSIQGFLLVFAQISEGDSLREVREKASAIGDAIVSMKVEDHFLSAKDVEEFEVAEVPQDERENIRAALQNARDLASKASFMSDPLKRSFLVKISKAENELFKEKVGLQAFWAAAYDGTRLLRRFGEDAQPLADAIEKARTSTERYTTGYDQIGMDEPPKQIEDKSGETDPSA
ncbi:hypothetical protein [Pacificibacter sp. AS14]|uniref:hypothetical protein n=1 Tax=Pacificibacter sp. AS14 TaxID=3135785 RepID=UPI00316E6465